MEIKTTFETDREINGYISSRTGKIHFDKVKVPYQGNLGIRISPKGKATWLVSYRFNGKRSKYSFGEYPAVKLKNARVEAIKLLEGVSKGVDPNRARQAVVESPDMTDLWAAYQKKLSLQKKPKAPATRSAEKSKWDNIIKPDIGNMKVVDVTPSILHDMLVDVASEFPVKANRLHSFLSVLFKPALAKGWITVHPLQFIDKPGGEEPPRKRILSDDEIKAVWPVLSKSEGNIGDILKMCLLSCQRSGEVKAMRWDDIDFDEGTWLVKNTKTDNDNLVPLSKQMLDVLESRGIESEGYVFAAKGKAGHSVNLAKPRLKIWKDSGTEGWTGHDLRRTARTTLSKLGVKPHVAERVLNHSQGGVAGTYDVYGYLPEKRIALDQLGRKIYSIVGLKSEENNIIQIRKQA